MLADHQSSFDVEEPALPAGLVARRFVILLVLGLLVYLPALRGSFFWDDEEYVSQNPDVIQRSGILNMWQNSKASEYVPVTTMVYWFEWGWWHEWTTGYHIDNVLLHGVNAGLLWLVLRRLRVRGAFLAGLLFLLHPVCVESVAWIAERRNVLALMLGLLTVLTYLRAEETTNRGSYYAPIMLFCAALLSKASIVMLPLVLLLMAWWLTGRIKVRDLRRTAPFFALSLVIGLIRIWFEQHRAMGSIDIHDFPFTKRAITAVEAVWFYVGKALYPLHLSLIYPRFSASLIWFVSASIAFVAVSIVLLAGRNSWSRPFLFAALYFVLMLFPALGFVEMSYMQHTNVTDHFQYFSLIAPVGLLGAGAARWPKFGLPAVVVLCLTFAGLTASRAWYFGHPDELWQLTVQQNPAAWTAHEHAGLVLYERSRITEAAEEFEKSVELRPENYRAWFNLGTMLHLESQYEQAINAYARALDLHPDLFAARARIEACRQRKPLVVR